jgi:hypothetical protein
MSERTPKTPVRAPEASPGPLAAQPCLSVPLAPAAAGQGDPAAASEHLEALAAAGLDVPSATGSHTTAASGPDVPVAAQASSALPAAGNKQPGPAVAGKTAAGPGDQPEALSGEEGRKAWQAALSAKAKTQRQRRARPWVGRDPLRKAVPGARKLPPGGEQR